MNIEPPEWLCEEAQVIFTDTVKLLGKAAQTLDVSLIADFAEAQADVIRLTKIVRFEGDITVSPKGIGYMNPSLTILISRRNALERLRHDLKLTPRARQAVLAKPAGNGLREEMGK